MRFAVPSVIFLTLAACGTSDVSVNEAPVTSAMAAPATVSGIPTYRASNDSTGSTPKNLAIAAKLHTRPGASVATAKGPVMARRVLVGRADYVVFSNIGRNSAEELAAAINRTDACYVPRGAIIHRIGSFSATGWAMPCGEKRS